MSDLLLLCVEDEPEVREALMRDLEPFRAICQIEEAEDVDDARGVLEQCGRVGKRLALILCDHLLPGTSGVDFLVELNERPSTAAARKVLVTGQAGLEDTVKAVNRAKLDHYIAKPWSLADLTSVVRTQLTNYVIDEVDDVLPYVTILDGARLMESMRGLGRTE